MGRCVVCTHVVYQPMEWLLGPVCLGTVWVGAVEWVWPSRADGCFSVNTWNELGGSVKTCIKFQQSLVKSRLVSNVERSTKPGRVRCELNLCVGSPVTEAYGKSDEVSESSRSYVGDGQRLCIKHREFLQNDNRKKARK